YATGPVSEVAMAVIGFSHGRLPAAAACNRKLNAAVNAIKPSTLGPEVDLRMIVMFRNTSIRLQLDTLDLIVPVGVSGYEQNLPDFAPRFDAGLFVNEDHQIHRLGDQGLLRRIRRLGDEAFEPDQSTQGIIC